STSTAPTPGWCWGPSPSGPAGSGSSPWSPCPLIRYHPVVVAQQAATVATMSEGRFVLGLGAGERLNEHVVGEGWPPVDVRHEMLGEAIDVLRHLWAGGFVSHRGPWFTVEDARIYDLPDR